MSAQLSDHNRGRPRHPSDFDWRPGLFNLRNHTDTPSRRVWTTPLWQNFVYLGFVLVTIIAAYALSYTTEFEPTPEPPWNYLLWSVIALIIVSLVGLLVSGALQRGRLVLDRDRRELRFYRRLIGRRAQACIALDDIVALLQCKIDSPDGDANSSSGWTYRIVAAELRDGRLVSIAIDSAASIRSAIRDA